MKKLISIFIVCILFIALVIGQCNASLYEYALDDKVAEESPDGSVDSNPVEIPQTKSVVSEQIVKRSAYVVSYNRETKIPNWVAWHLTANHAEGEKGRSNDFREDYDVPAPRASVEDYRGSGWSRGHMCPAGDNKWNAVAMSETFLLTNVCPQDRALNSGLWNRIEQDCRKWARVYGDVYIVCGPVLLNRKHETIGRNKVVVPEAFFKVILRLSLSQRQLVLL